MLRVKEVIDHLDTAWDTAHDTVLLDYDARMRRRAVLCSEAGQDILLDQPASRHLRDGQGLVLEDGRQVRIVARPERLVAISCANTATLVRIAWHLGNRHLATQSKANDAGGGELLIRADHVIEAMAAGLGGNCRQIEAPFDPEGGAYPASPAGQRHRHDHHVPDHDHHHDHDHNEHG